MAIPVAGIIAFVSRLMEWAPLIEAGIDGAMEAFEDGLDRVKQMVAEGRDPTEQEWAGLNAKTAEFRNKLHTD